MCNFDHLQISITVQPGAPVEISPDLSPGTPTVSNTRNAASRCLLRSLRVSLKDQYRNLVTDGYNGSVELKIVGPPGISEIPVFVGGSRSLTIPLTNGEAVLQVCVGGCGSVLVCVGVWVWVLVCVFCLCRPTWHLGDSRLRWRVALSHHSTHQWRGSTTGVCCVWVLVCVGVCVGVCRPTWHLGDSRLRWGVPVSHHSTHQWRGSTTGVCGCVLVWVCVCVFCVCWPTWHLGDSRLRWRVLVSHHSTHQWRGSTTGVCGCVLVWVCVGVGVCVGPPGISEIPVFVGGSPSLTIPLTNGEAVLQVCVGGWGVGISVSVLVSVWVLVCMCVCVGVGVFVWVLVCMSVCVGVGWVDFLCVCVCW